MRGRNEYACVVRIDATRSLEGFHRPLETPQSQVLPAHVLPSVVRVGRVSQQREGRGVVVAPDRSPERAAEAAQPKNNPHNSTEASGVEAAHGTTERYGQAGGRQVQ